jgi:hypothetical protein
MLPMFTVQVRICINGRHTFPTVSGASSPGMLSWIRNAIVTTLVGVVE